MTNKKYHFTEGQVVERLTVLKSVNGGYECMCSCGKRTVAKGSQLHHKRKRSCGCLAQEARASNGRRNALKNGNATRNGIITTYRSQCARRRNLICTLSDSDFDVLFAGDCFYCGRAPFNTQTYGRYSKPFTFNGVDRVDSSKGYFIGNVVSCCKRCNRAKNDMGLDEFYDWLDLVIKNLGIKDGKLARKYHCDERTGLRERRDDGTGTSLP